MKGFWKWAAVGLLILVAAAMTAVALLGEVTVSLEETSCGPGSTEIGYTLINHTLRSLVLPADQGSVLYVLTEGQWQRQDSNAEVFRWDVALMVPPLSCREFHLTLDQPLERGNYCLLVEGEGLFWTLPFQVE